MTSLGLSPLVLECARPQPDASVLLAHAVAERDWEAVVAQAEVHAFAPLLYWELNRSCADVVPASVLAGLRQRFLANARRNLLLGSELVRLVAVFGSAGLDVLAFKGPAVSWTLYENPALREMGDLDLLVHPRDARRAYELLISAGYDPAYPALHWRFLQSYNNEAPFTRGEIAVDLHWATTPGNFRPERDSEAAWQRSRRIRLAGGSVHTFAPEDLLIFLAVHGGKHCWTELKWLADISRLLAREPIRWQTVFERARAGESTRALLLALALVRDFLRVPIPALAEEMFRREPVARRLAAQVRAALTGSNGAAGTLSQLRFWMALSPGPISKARVLWQPLQPQIADHLWWRLPVWLTPVYYVTRPVRLAAKHGSHFFKNAQRGRVRFARSATS